MDDTQFFNLIKLTAERHGCTLGDVDFERRVINLDGPEDAKAICARAIADIVAQG
jgi:hypothetical protein